MTREQYQKRERKRVEQAQKDGYTAQEIAKAYEIARVLGRFYINEVTLQQAREELNK